MQGVPPGHGKDLQPLTVTEEKEARHRLHDLSDLVAIKTTEAPHYGRIAIQRAGVDAIGVSEFADVFPVGPLRSQPLTDTAELLTRGTSRRGLVCVRRSTSTRAADCLRLA